MVIVPDNWTSTCHSQSTFHTQSIVQTHLSNKKQPQNVIRLASSSVSSSLFLLVISIFNPRSHAIRKLMPLYTHPFASLPHPASLTDISASACTVVRAGTSCRSSSSISLFASLKKWSPAVAESSRTALAAGHDVKWQPSANMALTSNGVQYSDFRLDPGGGFPSWNSFMNRCFDSVVKKL